MTIAPLRAASPMSVAEFDKKARSGEPVNVVFFGGSLTWGANASDPLTTSYRGRMMQYLVDKYPRTPIHFHDAAIGGTGSSLGIFRLQRDVLTYKPDLVFLDFTVNDGAENTDVEALATYERAVREILGSGSGVVQVLMCFKYHFNHPEDPFPPRIIEHLKLAAAYHLPVANIYGHIQELVRAKKLDPADIWYIGKDDTHPADGAHPGDEGYQLFFEVVRDVYEKAIASGEPMIRPEQTLFEDKYPKFQRKVLVADGMPKGWQRRHTYRTSLWFDGLASRWMGDIAGAMAKDSPDPLVVKFTGSLVGIFGEHDSFTPPIKVFIDDKPIAPPKAKEGEFLWKLDTTRFAPPKRGSGNLFLWQLFPFLEDGEHTLRIEPVFDGCPPESELRIESVCTAGR